jgi:AcrR family transcriptional regulator
MGNREDLLAGARQCLLEKGYARTTARDIANASGVSLAAIGYHFGSKELLLNEALRGAIEAWGEEVAAALAAAAEPGAGAAERFEATWTRVIDSFATTRRLWAIQFELLAHLERAPELRRTFTEANHQARLGLADLFGADVRSLEPRQAEMIGAYYQALLVGLAAQWLADPESLPSGSELLQAVRAVAANLPPADSEEKAASRKTINDRGAR